MSDEKYFLSYLEKYKFGKQLEGLEKKFKGKKVVLYGAGAFFETLNANYDLSGLDIVAVADRKFESECEFLSYRAVPPAKIEELKQSFVNHDISDEICY